jgi:predicted DNA binding CopG/RHH family protein
MMPITYTKGTNMVLKKKIEDHSKIEQIIDRGGEVSSDKKKKTQWSHVNLRITSNMLSNIDIRLSKRIGLSRNAWILEAIQDKLSK